MSDTSSVPPSPTLSSSSGPYPTTLALRENQPELRFNSSLLSPDSPIHNRKASVGTLTSSNEGTVVEEHRSEKSASGSDTHSYTQYDASRSPSRERTQSASPERRPEVQKEEKDQSMEKGKKKTKMKKDDEEEEDPAGHRAELKQDANFDPTPFRFKPYQLAHMLDPKNLDTLQDIGGTSGLLRGLGSDSIHGLGSGPGRADGRPGAGDGASDRHDPEREVPAITLTEPGGDVHSTHASDIDDEAAFAASFDDRRRVYGPNVLPERRSKSLLQLMWTALKDKVLILLSIAAVVSLALGFFQDFGVTRDASDGPPVDWVEGVAIMVAIIIVVVVGSLNDWQKERQFKSLNERKEERGVKVIRDGVEKQVVVGDIALLEPGEIVPCDGVFLGGHNVRCDESGATGESDAIKKVTFEECKSMLHKREEAAGHAADLAHTDCFIVSGSKILEGVGKYVVVAVGTKSFNGRIMMALRGGGENTPLQLKLNFLAELIAKLGSLAGLILFSALMIRFFVQLGAGEPVRSANEKGIAFVNILIISVTLIVVAVPEGLPLAVTLALAFATKRMTYENLLVRVLGSCETMANASVVCTDKTGTLTQNVMTVVAGSVGVHAKFVRQLEENQTRTNVGEEEPGHRKHPHDFSIDQSQLNDTMTPALRSLFNEAIAVNSTAFQDIDPESGAIIFVGSKTETALLKFARELGWADFKKTRDGSNIIQMIPFSSERKAMGVVVKLGEKKWRFYVKGASEILSRKCTHYVVVQKPGNPSPVQDDVEVTPIDDHSADNIARTIIFYANQTLRTIALCYRDFDAWPPPNSVHDEQNEVEYASLAHDLTLIGITGIEDPLRDGVRDAVAKCHKAGVTVKMCTGDNVLTARSIASQCGIYTSGGIIMEGPIFRKLDRNDMLEIVPRLQVLARSSPEDKKLLVETLKSLGEIVGVTGDGTNDGPALKTANVGFSMGIAGTEVAKEASDIILMDDNFSSIVKAIIWGRCVNDAVRKFLQFQISTNITAVIITFVTAVASTDEEPVLTAVQLLWINIIMDTFAALALATDPATEKLLDRKPDKKTAPLFSADMYKMILFQSIYQITISLVFHFLGLQILGLDGSDHNDTVVQTLVFNAFVFAQIFNSVNCRRLDRKLNVFEGITKNYYFIGITLIEIAVQILIVFVGGAAFEVTRVGGREWGISLALGVVSIPLGVAVRLMPTKPFEKVFKKLGLLGGSEILPTKNADTEGWTGAITVVRDNLGTFANLRGGRVRSSSFVVKSRRATLSDDQGPMRLSSLLTMAPTMMAGAVAAGHSYIKSGNLSDPAHNDPSVSSAALWEGKLQLHPDTPRNDPVYKKFGGQQNMV
ncbi:calcium-translocating P-type ATPase [Guyanagaster necrorhizus]|uniref:Calcium-transporting ATPase n=1 Tax=Guyanagaster necrorhizus TaxID=856835 RepID=A0A9P7VQP3_9AGAR|nr:calcium-translocating P-type ATPase [Guyanagaster necrorhizus MCA 3950]KAG7444251.1 calcium-translocating P-type ATPase [Guyanagaster necrorhizus MCA 3950]